MPYYWWSSKSYLQISQRDHVKHMTLPQYSVGRSLPASVQAWMHCQIFFGASIIASGGFQWYLPCLMSLTAPYWLGASGGGGGSSAGTNPIFYVMDSARVGAHTLGRGMCEPVKLWGLRLWPKGGISVMETAPSSSVTLRKHVLLLRERHHMKWMESMGCYNVQ